MARQVSKNIIIQDYYHKGFKMVDYPSFITSLKATWIKRLIKTETEWTKPLESTMKISVSTIWQGGRDYSYTLIKRLINIFWKEDLASWLQIDETYFK